jgi:class 3 adenylate cyclase
MPDLPTGTVTFLFTDIDGSTRLWEQHPDVMGAVVARPDALPLLTHRIRHGGGQVVNSRARRTASSPSSRGRGMPPSCPRSQGSDKQ